MGTHLTPGEWGIISSSRPPSNQIILAKIEDLLRGESHWIVTNAETSGDRYADAVLMANAKRMKDTMKKVSERITTLTRDQIGDEAYTLLAQCYADMADCVNKSVVV